MRMLLLALATTTVAAAGHAQAADLAEPYAARPYAYRSGYAYPPPVYYSEEARDEARDRMERRQEWERRALREHQRQERRLIDPDD